MDIEPTELTDDQQRGRIEGIIKRLRPGVKFRWNIPKDREEYPVTLNWPGHNLRLRFSANAMDATEDRANMPRLEGEIEKALRVSESGKAVGFVKWDE